MASISKVMVGESSSATGMRLRISTSSLARAAAPPKPRSAYSLTNNKDGFTTLLALIAPNLPAKPHTVIFNKVTIKEAKQAVQMFGPAQHAVARAVSRLCGRGADPAGRGR